MLSIENLKAKIDEKEILKGLNLNIKPGEVHWVRKKHSIKHFIRKKRV